MEMIDKQQIQMIFLFEFKMGCKAAETTWNINNAFGPGTANQHTVWYSEPNLVVQEVLQRRWTLKMKNAVAGHWKLTSDQLRGSSKLILLQLTKRSCQSTQCQPFYVILHLMQIGKVVSGHLMSWP